MSRGRLLREENPSGEPCSCRWPLTLPWRKLRPGAVWECARCLCQWELVRQGAALAWVVLPVERRLATAAGPDEVPAAWRGVLRG